MIDSATRQRVGTVPANGQTLGVGAELIAVTCNEAPFGYSINHRETNRVLVRIGIDVPQNGVSFSPDGRRFAYAADHGAIVVVDLPTLQRELAAVNLGW